MKHNYEIVESKGSHVAMLERLMRENDRIEVTCMGMAPRKALWSSFRTSIMRKTAFVDGDIACMWGLGGSLLSGIGNPWLLTGHAVERLPVTFIRHIRHETDGMLGIFPKLHGYVIDSYGQALRMLKLAGFDLSEPFEFGPERALFRKYTKER